MPEVFMSNRILRGRHQEGWVSFNRLRKMLGGTDGSIYSHLKKLLSAGYIKQKRQIAGEKAQTIYTLTPAGRKLFKDYLSFLEELLKQQKGDSR